MLKFIFRLCMCIMLIMACTSIASCSDDDPTPGNPSIPDEETGEPVEDMVTEKVTVPTVVIGNDFDPVTSALINRLTTRDYEIGPDTKAVIIDGGLLLSLSEAQSKTIKDVYDRGGSIVLSEADPKTAYDFSMSLGEEPCFIVEEETKAGQEHFCDVYIFNNHNDEYIVQDVHASIEDYTTITEGDNEIERNNGEVIRHTEDMRSFDNFTPYQYGLRADKLAIWINGNSAPHNPVGRSDASQLAAAQRVAIDYYPTHPSHDKAKNISGSYTIIYSIVSLYSFDQNVDYYAVHQEIIGSNQAMKIANWKEGKNTCYGFYLSRLENDHYIYGQNNSTPSATIQTTSPATTENARQESVSMGFNIGGDVGLSTTGPSAGISGGYSYSESVTVTIPDVAIINKSKSDAAHLNAKWTYEVAYAKPNYNGWGTLKGFYEAPAVATNTIDTHNTWLWVVNNPTGKYTMKCVNYIAYAYCSTWDTTFKYYWNNSYSGYIYTRWITLNPPKRTRN